MSAARNEELPSKVRDGARPEDYRQQSDIPPPNEAFETIPERASAGPRQSASGRGRRDAMPEAVVRPRQPVRPQPPAQTKATPTPWVPPNLRTLLPGLAVTGLLLAIPVAAAFGLQFWLARTHLVYDGSLVQSDGSPDEATALKWGPADGKLHVGTRAGMVFSIDPGVSLDHALTPPTLGPVTPVQSIDLASGQQPVMVFQDRLEPRTDQMPGSYVATNNTSGTLSASGGLFAAVEANNGSAVVGRLAAQYAGQALDIPNNTWLNAAPPEQQQVQQQQVQPPAGGTLQEPVPIDPTGLPRGRPRYDLALVRDLQGRNPTEVGQIFGIEDVRAVAALPGTNTVIAGDGSGNVFAIDASQQISGVSPETYIRGIGQHETAIVEIAVAAQPGDGAVLFATRAEDRTIRVWRGGVSRASQLIPLGDYPSADVATPGSTWARERFEVQTSDPADGAITALLSMSSDGRRILANWGSGDSNLRVIDVPLPDEPGTVRQYGAFTRTPYTVSTILSPDGTRMLAVNAASGTVDLVDLATIGDGIDPLPVLASFGTMAGFPMARLAFDRGGDRFIALAGNGTVFIQDVATPDQAITLGQYQSTGIEAAISPDGSLVAVAESSGQIMIHSAEDGSELTIVDGPQNLDRLTFDGSGRRLRASTSDTLRVYTYSLRNLRNVTYDSGLPAAAGLQDFIPDGDRYFMRNGSAGFRMVDIDSGATAGTLQAATGATHWLSNLDGSRIATLGGRGNVSLFRERESATEIGPMPAMSDNALRLSADGRTLLVGDRGGELFVARLDGEAGETGYRLHRLALPAPVLQYEIAPDGAAVVSAEADGTVSISELAGEAPADATSQGVTITQTIEISGHGAPLTAMALSPDGERLATAGLDGRLRVTSVAWARLVHQIPLAALPSGPERTKLEPQQLDESPYAFMSGSTSSDFGDGQLPEQPFIVVYNARRSLDQAQGARERAAAAGFPDGLIYRRQGFFRGVFAFETAEARDAALPGIRQAFSGAYARELGSWCPDATAVENFIDCPADAAMVGSAPPAMAN